MMTGGLREAGGGGGALFVVAAVVVLCLGIGEFIGEDEEVLEDMVLVGWLGRVYE